MRRWWWPFVPQRTDDEIATRIATMVDAGEISPELAHLYERALRDEQAGRCIVMRDPKIRPKPPRKPSWERW
jgi:hypothetical protein